MNIFMVYVGMYEHPDEYFHGLRRHVFLGVVS